MLPTALHRLLSCFFLLPHFDFNTLSHVWFYALLGVLSPPFVSLREGLLFIPRILPKLPYPIT